MATLAALDRRIRQVTGSVTACGILSPGGLSLAFILLAGAPRAGAAVQADLLIKQGGQANGSYDIGSTYQTTPSGNQIESQTASGMVPVVYHVKLQNNGDTAHAFVLKAVESVGAGWTIVYRNTGGTNDDVSLALVGAGYTTTSLAPGASEVITITVTPDNTVSASATKDTTISAYNDSGDATVRDCVRATTTATGWHSYYVAPGGSSSGNGSFSAPWDLVTALAQPSAVHAGDTLWLRGGAYSLDGYVTGALTGTASAPIKLRQYPGERATIDAGTAGQININGPYAWYWGFELMSSASGRSAASGAYPTRGWGLNAGSVAQDGVKIINVVQHDTASSISMWKPTTNGEINGCVIYNNGYDETGSTGKMPGLWLQNDTTPRLIKDNIIFHQYADGIYGYTVGGTLKNFNFRGNISFENGVISSLSGRQSNLFIGGGQAADTTTYDSNYTYFNPAVSAGASGRLGYTTTATALTITNNYFISGLTSAEIHANSLALTGNSFYGATSGFTQGSYPANTYYSTRPTGTVVAVRPNDYDLARANIAVYNWDNLDAVAVDISSIPGLQVGDAYEVRDAQNIFGPAVASGRFTGATINLPMNLTAVSAVIGTPCTAAVHTPKEFNAFVLVRTEPVGQPDLLIKQSGEADSAYAINNTYQGTPSGDQIEQQNTDTSVAAVYNVRVENDAAVARTYCVKATQGAGSGWTITYMQGATNITTDLLGGGYTTGSLAAGGSEILTVSMMPDGTVARGATKTTTINAYLSSQSTVPLDAVQATTKVNLIDQPDLLIKGGGEPDTAYQINDTYQTVPAAEQIEDQSASLTETAAYDIEVQNDGANTRTFCVKATEGVGTDWTIAYKVGTADITSQVLGAGHTTASLAFGATEIVTVEVTSGASHSVGDTKATTVKVFLDGSDVTVRDAVQAVTTVSPPGRPDLQIKRVDEQNSLYAIAGVYQTVPSGDQLEAMTTSATIPAVYHVKVVNDDSSAHAYCLKATEGAGAGWTVVYKTGSTDVTADMTGAGFTTTSLAASAGQVVTIYVTPDNSVAAGATKAVTVNAYSSASDANVRDAVRMTTTATGWRAYYCTPTGTAGGDGSMASPWSLTYLYTSPAAVTPGCTIWMREGVYPVVGWPSCTLSGVAGAPVKLRQYPGETAIIDTGNDSNNELFNRGHDVWWWGMQFRGTGTDRSGGSNYANGNGGAPQLASSTIICNNQKMINLIIQNTNTACGFWMGSVDGEWYGSIHYFNGWHDPATRSHGHGLYLQNDTGRKTVKDNIVWANFNEGIQAYITSAKLDHVDFIGNICFENGSAGPGGRASNIIICNYPFKDITVLNNSMYHNSAANQGTDLDMGNWNQGHDAIVQNNICMGGYSSAYIDVGTLTLTGNKFWPGTSAFSQAAYPNNTYYGTTRPTGLWSVVRPNQYEPTKGYVAVYNWDGLNSTNVDVSTICGMQPGDYYEVVDVQNPLGPAVANGIFGGSTVTLPLNCTAVATVNGAPSGYAATYVHTPKEFNCFIVRKADPAAGSHTLNVQSDPPGAAITGTHAGTTNYSMQVNDNVSVSLTAPSTISPQGVEHTFSHWTLNSEAKPDNQTTLTFNITADTTAVAVYTSQSTTWQLDVQSTPVPGAAITGTPAGATDYSATLDDNASVSLTAPASFTSGSTAYNFVRWTRDSVPGTDGVRLLSFSMTSDSTVVAEYEQAAATHLLTVQSSPVSAVAITGAPAGTTEYTSTRDNGSAVTLTAPSQVTSGPTTYNFVHWVLNDDWQTGGVTTLSFDIERDSTAVAVYAPASATRQLSVQSMPVTGVSIAGLPAGTTPYTSQRDDGTFVSLTAPPAFSVGNTDYVFVHWMLNNSNQPDGQTNMSFSIDLDVTAVAVYTIAQRALYVQSSPMRSLSITGTACGSTNYCCDRDDNTSVTLTAPAATTFNAQNYVFLHWTLNGAAQTDGVTALSLNINAHTTATAVYDVLRRTLTVQSYPFQGVSIAGAPAAITNMTCQVFDAATVSMTAPANATSAGVYYDFAGWTLNGIPQTLGNQTLSFSMTQDTTVVAVYKWVRSLKITGPKLVIGGRTVNYAVRVYYGDGTTRIMTAAARWKDNCSYAKFVRPGRLKTTAVRSNLGCKITAIYGGKSKRYALTICRAH